MCVSFWGDISSIISKLLAIITYHYISNQNIIKKKPKTMKKKTPTNKTQSSWFSTSRWCIFKSLLIQHMCFSIHHRCVRIIFCLSFHQRLFWRLVKCPHHEQEQKQGLMVLTSLLSQGWFFFSYCSKFFSTPPLPPAFFKKQWTRRGKRGVNFRRTWWSTPHWGITTVLQLLIWYAGASNGIAVAEKRLRWQEGK